MPSEIYGVYHNEGNGTFSYGSLETGLGVLSSGSSGWGVGLEDFDNDGWKDLFVAQGHVLDNVEQIDPSLHYWELPLLAMNHNGRFERADSGSTAPVAGRGAAFGDLNNDGWQDVVMSSLGGRPQIFMNRGGKQHWLVISLRGTRSNRDGFGARVRVNGQTRFATCSRQLSFFQRQAPAFWTGLRRKGQSRNCVAFGRPPDYQRRSRRPVSRSP